MPELLRISRLAVWNHLHCSRVTKVNCVANYSTWKCCSSCFQSILADVFHLNQTREESEEAYTLLSVSLGCNSESNLILVLFDELNRILKKLILSVIKTIYYVTLLGTKRYCSTFFCVYMHMRAC